MSTLRTSGAAALAALTTIGTLLVSAGPAHADITVDSAICLQNATGALTSSNPVVAAPGHPTFQWTASLPYTQCAQSNGHLYLVDNGVATLLPANSGNGVEGGPGRHVLILRVKTSLGQRDLSSVTLTTV
ncbi:hypothetical protein ABT369_16935 [Dactylosporangium sp. NPDC000244]|uniref:hypothetical protein n=1 Tax=Dactylosporangium sp. NPDC000244 TaxID=3154365 RepID=UPI003320A22E